jgi:hypothetical protein
MNILTDSIATATVDATFGIIKADGTTEDYRTGKKLFGFPTDSKNERDNSLLAISYLHEWVEELLKDGESIVSYKIHYSDISL